jgi:hypothetical protein
VFAQVSTPVNTLARLGLARLWPFAAFRPSRPGPCQGPPSHPLLYSTSCERSWVVKSALSHRTLQLASVGGIVRDPERPIAIQVLPALWTHAPKLWIRTPISCVWELPPLRWLLYTTETAPVLWLQGKPHGELPGLCEVGRSEGRSCKAAARSWPK